MWRTYHFMRCCFHHVQIEFHIKLYMLIKSNWIWWKISNVFSLRRWPPVLIRGPIRARGKHCTLSCWSTVRRRRRHAWANNAHSISLSALQIVWFAKRMDHAATHTRTRWAVWCCITFFSVFLIAGQQRIAQAKMNNKNIFKPNVHTV